MEKTNKKRKGIFTIVSNLFLCAFFVFALLSVAITLVSKNSNDDAANIFGYETRVVISPSMEKSEFTDTSKYKIKSINVNSLVLIKRIPDNEEQREMFYQQIKIGDVLTFKYVYSKQETITHRVVEVQKKDTGGYLIHLEGDNKNSDQSTLRQVIDTSKKSSPNYIIGEVVGQSSIVGNTVVGLKSKVGMVLMIIVPCSIVLIWQVVKILNVLKVASVEKHKKISEEKENELVLLRKKIEELESKI